MKVTVASLRQSGYRVRVTHRRAYTLSNVPLSKYEAEQANTYLGERLLTGGSTTVEITTPDGDTLIGEANVYYKDTFNRKLGLKIALGRAMVGVPETVG